MTEEMFDNLMEVIEAKIDHRIAENENRNREWGGFDADFQREAQRFKDIFIFGDEP